MIWDVGIKIPSDGPHFRLRRTRLWQQMRRAVRHEGKHFFRRRFAAILNK